MTDPTVPVPPPPAPTLKEPARLTMREQVEACREAARLLEAVRSSRYHANRFTRARGGFLEGKVEAILDEAIGSVHKALVWVDDRPQAEQLADEPCPSCGASPSFTLNEGRPEPVCDCATRQAVDRP